MDFIVYNLTNIVRSITKHDLIFAIDFSRIFEPMFKSLTLCVVIVI